MSLKLNVLHNPGTTYAEKEIPGFITILVSTLVPKDIKNIIQRTNKGKYVTGSFNTDEKTDSLKEGDIDIIIPLQQLKEDFDTSGNIVIFKCHIKSCLLMRHSIGDCVNLGVKINLGEAVYDYSEALTDIKERATIHSVYVKLENGHVKNNE